MINLFEKRLLKKNYTYLNLYNFLKNYKFKMIFALNELPFTIFYLLKSSKFVAKSFVLNFKQNFFENKVYKKTLFSGLHFFLFFNSLETYNKFKEYLLSLNLFNNIEIINNYFIYNSIKLNNFINCNFINLCLLIYVFLIFCIQINFILFRLNFFVICLNLNNIILIKNAT